MENLKIGETENLREFENLRIEESYNFDNLKIGELENLRIEEVVNLRI